MGIQATAVKPPATAAAQPLAMVSLLSPPGSRRCTCASTSPGRTIFPFSSRTGTSTGPRDIETASIRFPLTRISAGPSQPLTGSCKIPPFKSRSIFSPTSRLKVNPGRPCEQKLRSAPGPGKEFYQGKIVPWF